MLKGKYTKDASSLRILSDVSTRVRGSDVRLRVLSQCVCVCLVWPSGDFEGTDTARATVRFLVSMCETRTTPFDSNSFNALAVVFAEALKCVLEYGFNVPF